MARQSLVAATVERFSDDVLEGHFPPETQLPPEADLAERYGVSRLTIREALKLLQAQGVVRGVRGRRNEVAPVAEWTGLEMLVRSVSRGHDAGPVALQLVAVRRMIETGAAALAAEHRTDADLAALEEHLEGMRAAHRAADVDAFVRGDIAFHDVVLRAGGNVFLAVVMEPLGRVLRHARRDTSSHEPVQRHAIAEHEHVLEAVRGGDPVRARAAMDAHMDQTEADLRHFVLGGPAAPTPGRPSDATSG